MSRLMTARHMLEWHAPYQHAVLCSSPLEEHAAAGTGIRLLIRQPYREPEYAHAKYCCVGVCSGGQLAIAEVQDQ